LYAATGVYKKRYIDLINRTQQPQEDAEEIVRRIMEKGGLHFEGE